jgi:hypothetical protein
MIRGAYLRAARALWRWRLTQARRHRNGMEVIARSELAKAQFDVEYCRKKFARADMAVIEARADRALARGTT